MMPLTIQQMRLVFSMRLPVRYFGINQHFGENRFFIYKDGEQISYYKSIGLAGHNGFDLSTAAKEEGVAPYDGKVYLLQTDAENGGYGNTLYMRSEVMRAGGIDFYIGSVHAHLESFLVGQGQYVKKGDKLYICDNTGMSSGHHLHLGIWPMFWIDGQWRHDADNGYNGKIDPYPFFEERFPTGTHKYWTTVAPENANIRSEDEGMWPVDMRYHRYWPGERPWHAYMNERLMLWKLGRRGLKAGKDFTAQEIKALVYGAWGYDDVFGNTGIAITKTWQLRRKY